MSLVKSTTSMFRSITQNQVLFVMLMFIPATFYTLAAFYNLVYPAKSIVTAIFIAVLFATTEYAFKVPIIKFGGNNGFTPFSIQVCWIVLTVICSYVMNIIYKKTIHGNKHK